MAEEVLVTTVADNGDDGTPVAGGCVCGESDAPGYPELDARAIPHEIRHAAIFGALDGIAPGAGLVLVAPHDPLGLLAQLQQRVPDTYDIDYLQRGPEAWRLRFVRRVP